MRRAVGMVAMALLGGCAGGAAPRGAGAVPVADDAVKTGPPYTVNGTRYVPADDAYYDALGLASWYGAESGARTANGEAHGGHGYSAAHPTLPLPSYVEVTSLATGRTIVVRVNDRGPFTRGRLIDLSQDAGKALGIDGSASVRVRRVYPSEDERAALRQGQASAPRLPASSQLLTTLRARLAAGGGGIVRLAEGPMPDVRSMGIGGGEAPEPPQPDAGVLPRPFKRPPTPVVEPVASPAIAPETAPRAIVRKPAPVPGAGAPAHGWSVQLGAFGDAARAAALARETGGHVAQAGALGRVRVGPFRTEAEAREALAKLRARGYGGAAVVRE